MSVLSVRLQEAVEDEPKSKLTHRSSLVSPFFSLVAITDMCDREKLYFELFEWLEVRCFSDASRSLFERSTII